MRIWTLHEGADTSKFAELLANGATDVVWAGGVSMINTQDYDDTDLVNDVVYLDKDGDVASYEVGDFSPEGDTP